MNINTPDKNHTGPTPVNDPRIGTVSWLPYTDDSKLAIVKAALAVVGMRAILTPGNLHCCNQAFTNLPGKVSFSDLWLDADVWISYNPNPRRGLYGVRLPGTKEIAISEFAFTQPQPYLVVAATIVHEMAHVAGAPGNTTDAEDTLPACGFKDQYKSGLLGQLRGADPQVRRA